MTTKQLSLPINGIRTGQLGSLPMNGDYMTGVQARAKMLAKACAVKPYPNTSCTINLKTGGPCTPTSKK